MQAMTADAQPQLHLPSSRQSLTSASAVRSHLSTAAAESVTRGGGAHRCCRARAQLSTQRRSLRPLSYPASSASSCNPPYTPQLLPTTPPLSARPHHSVREAQGRCV